MVTQQAEDHSSGGRVFVTLWLAFFFHGMTSGFWIPSLTNIFKNLGISQWVALAFMIPPLCALISPVIGGALADQRMAANRLFAWSGFVGALFLFAAFGSLDLGWNPWWFIILLGCYSMCSGPMWGLLAMISFSHLKDVEKEYPWVRMAGTIGWVVACGLGSYLLHLDTSVSSGYVATAARVVTGVVGVFLPFTAPLGKGLTWKGLLGFDAFGMLKQRDHLVFFLVTALFSIPLAAFYMYAPELFLWLGYERPTAAMAIGQLTEIVTMMFVGVLMTRFRIKTILLWSLGLSALRYGLSAYAGHTGEGIWHLIGVALHGICYTFYFITAQVFLDRRVDVGMRGQAQGLLAFVSAGVGPCLGAWVCGGLRTTLVDESGRGWMDFWAVLAGMISVCFVGFALFYRGAGAGARGR